MKALQLVPAMEEGGVERYVVRLNQILVNGGWENVVVSRGGKLEAEITRDGGRTIHLETKSKNPLSVPLRIVRLRRLLVREKPDVVCAHSRVPAWLFALASRGLNLRWMTYAHGANSISRYSRVMTKGDRILCPSGFVRDYLIRAYGTPYARFRVIPHAIDANRFDPNRTDATVIAELRRDWKIVPGTKVVMSIGRITRIKGFDMLIRTIPLLVARDPSVKLVIVGGAERGKLAYLDELKALVRSLNVTSRVVFAGAQSHIPECLSLADVVVSANTVKPESFGLTMAEALMMGKPVVAKAFGGACDIVRDGTDGTLVRCADDPNAAAPAFAEAIAAVLAHDYGDLRASARARFNFDIMSAETLKAYEELAR